MKEGGRMTREEVVRTLRAKADEMVTVRFTDGTTQRIRVHLVDDEGMVYFVAAANEDGEQAYWTPFDRIESVSARGPAS